MLDELNLDEKTKSTLLSNIMRRLTPQAVKIRADIEVSCYAYEGIDAVKNSLLEGLKCSSEDVPIKVSIDLWDQHQDDTFYVSTVVFLFVFSFECHLSTYQPGRTISFILFILTMWQEEIPYLLEQAPPLNKRRIWDKKVNKRCTPDAVLIRIIP